MVLTEIEERCAGSNLGHKLSSREEFLIGSYSSPLLVAFSDPSI
jgi:hypothetical protein